MKGKKMQIRNSTADFLVFTKDSGDGSIEVRVQDHEVWLTQKSLGQLFDVDRSVITKHLKNVFQEGELDETTTCANFAQVAQITVEHIIINWMLFCNSMMLKSSTTKAKLPPPLLKHLLKANLNNIACYRINSTKAILTA